MAKKKKIINEENVEIQDESIKIDSNITEEVEEVKEIVGDKPNKKGKKIIISIIIVLVAASLVLCYFLFIKDSGTKKKKDNSNNSSTKKEDNNDKNETNNIINYDTLSSKVKNAKKNTLHKCDCSKVNDEADSNKSVCTEYTVSNEQFLTIVDKLKQTKDAKELPTGTSCSTYSFESADANNKRIIMGFVSDDLKNILVGYNNSGYAFDYHKDLSSFFDAIISKSTKVDNKEEESTELTNEEIKLLINKIKKYELLDLRNSDKKVTFSSSNVTNEMMQAMFSYVSGQDDSFSEHWDSTTWSFKKSKADDYFSAAFGFVPKEYSDLICPVEGEALLVYDKSAGTFTYNDEHPGHGGMIGGFLDYKVTSSKKENNTYVIDVLFLRGNEMDGYYINDEEFNVTYEYEDGEGPSIYKNEFKYIDSSKYPKYSFEFEKVKDNYILNSITYKK